MVQSPQFWRIECKKLRHLGNCGLRDFKIPHMPRPHLALNSAPKEAHFRIKMKGFKMKFNGIIVVALIAALGLFTGCGSEEAPKEGTDNTEATAGTDNTDTNTDATDNSTTDNNTDTGTDNNTDIGGTGGGNSTDCTQAGSGDACYECLFSRTWLDTKHTLVRLFKLPVCKRV